MGAASLRHVVPYALVVMMLGVESYAGRLRREDAQTRDNGSLWILYALIATGYGLAFGLARGRDGPGPQLGAWATWTGAAVAVSGMALRVWSVATLGRYFTYVVKVSDDQTVVQTGPYRLLRHPSYAGALLMAIGIGLSLRYALAPVFAGGFSLVAYALRIRVEERALAEGIGEPYRAYMARTKRLVPFVW